MGSRDLLLTFWDPLYIWRAVEARNFKFGWQIGHWGTNEKMQNLVNVTRWAGSRNTYSNIGKPQRRWVKRLKTVSIAHCVYNAMQQPVRENHYYCLQRCKFLPQYMTTCLGIRKATHWTDTRSTERISCNAHDFSS